MKGHEPMNWNKRQTQAYGLFMAILGAAIGAMVTYVLTVLI